MAHSDQHQKKGSYTGQQSPTTIDLAEIGRIIYKVEEAVIKKGLGGYYDSAVQHILTEAYGSHGFGSVLSTRKPVRVFKKALRNYIEDLALMVAVGGNHTNTLRSNCPHGNTDLAYFVHKLASSESNLEAAMKKIGIDRHDTYGIVEKIATDIESAIKKEHAAQASIA